MAEQEQDLAQARQERLPYRQHGPCDNAAFIRKYLGGNPFFDHVFLGTIEIYPLTDDWSHDDAVTTIIHFANVGKWIHLNPTQMIDEDLIYAGTLAEGMGTCISRTKIPNQQYALNLFVNSVRALIMSPILPRYSSATAATFQEAITALMGDGEAPARVAGFNDLGANCLHTLFVGDNRLNPVPRDIWTRLIAPQGAEGFPPQWAMVILYFLVRQAIPAMRRSALSMIVNAMVCFAKRGSVTPQFCNKVMQGIQDDLGKNVTISDRALAIMYKNYGESIDSVNIRPTFARWLTILPAHALRLTLTIQQVAGTGLAVYFTISKAVSTYRDFNWFAVSDLLPDDWNCYVRAVAIVRNDVYYGFNKDLGQAKSTLYKNLGWVAKELLVKVGGDAALNAYAGWPRRVPNQLALTRLIDDYITRRANDVDENIPPTAQFVNEIADIIRNTNQ